MLVHEAHARDADPDSLSPSEKAESFVTTIVSLKNRGRLTVKKACILLYWANGGRSSFGRWYCEPVGHEAF